MIVIGTRGSALALWQAHHVETLLKARANVACRIQIIKTQGDVVRHVSLEKLEGKGFFTKELEEALLAGTIDLAVHSLKDLPTTPPPGLEIAAIPEREDPSEMLLIHPEAWDPDAPLIPVRHGAVLGTSSNRRRALALAYRPDLTIAALRGNVPTRVEKLKQRSYDAILLAHAGLKRLELDLAPLHTLVLDPTVWLPAPGQGALALQIRSGDEDTRRAVVQLHAQVSALQARTERQLLALLQGGCHLPLGTYAQIDNQKILLHALLGEEPGEGRTELRPWPVTRVVVEGRDGDAVARAALEQLLDRRVEASSPSSAAHIQGETRPLAGKSIVVTRAADRSDGLVTRLEGLGAKVIRFPTVQQELDVDLEALETMLARLRSGDWVLFASAAAVTYLLAALKAGGLELPSGLRFGAIGPATARALEQVGLSVELMPDEAIAEAFVDAFARTQGGAGGRRPRIFLPSAREGRTALEEGLRRHGFESHRLTVYRTVLPDGDALPDLTRTHTDAVLFLSPSAAENFARLSPWPESAMSVTIGPTTSAAVRGLGLPVHREAREHSLEGVVQALIEPGDDLPA